jgi:hypothetical protein
MKESADGVLICACGKYMYRLYVWLERCSEFAQLDYNIRSLELLH